MQFGSEKDDFMGCNLFENMQGVIQVKGMEYSYFKTSPVGWDSIRQPSEGCDLRSGKELE